MASLSLRNRSPWSPLRSLSACLALGVVTLAAVPSCSVIIDNDALGCSSDEDCINHPGKGKCDTALGQCITADTCSSSKDCGEGNVCTFTEPRACTPITAGNCQIVEPNDPSVYQDDSSILIGLTSPLTEGGNPSSTGVSILNATILAVREINEGGGANGKNKLVLIACDDTGERLLAEENGQTLAKMGVQALVGPAFSGQTLDMAKGPSFDKTGTVALGVLNISSSATSTEITGIDDKAPACRSSADCPGLVWRTSPSDLLQGQAMLKYFPTLSNLALNRVAPPRTASELKVAILHKGDSYGTNLATFVYENLVSVPVANKVRLDYGDTSVANVDPDPAKIDEAIQFQADVYVLIGTNELGTADTANAKVGILQTIEENWSDTTPDSKPFYLFADGGLISEVENAAQLTGARLRVRGTIPGAIPDGTMMDPITLFTGRYESMFPNDVGAPEIFGAAGAYDATYLLAYSVAAAGGAPMTGEQFARGLLRVSKKDATSMEKIEVGKPQFGSANSILQNGGQIDFVGASGPLNFDPVSGEAPSDIQVWCIGSTNKGVTSNLYYSAASDDMKGIPDDGASCPFVMP